MNEILKLLGTTYSLNIEFNVFENRYEVRVTNTKDKRTVMNSFDMCAAEYDGFFSSCLGFDILVKTVEHSIFELINLCVE